MTIENKIRRRAYREAKKIASPERVREVAETMIRRIESI